MSKGPATYAICQADFHLCLLTLFKQTWDQPALKVAREASEMDMQLAEIFMAN